MIATSNRHYTDVLKDLLSKGGPSPEDDKSLNQAIQELYTDYKNNQISPEELEHIRNMMDFSTDTIQGFVYLKPNGYAGCYETIERIYNHYYSSDPTQFNWDRYVQDHPAAIAVKNRKKYFVQTVHQALKGQSHLKILNVASGPGRDIYELLEQNPDLPVHIHCIEQDERAIEYASELCKPFLDKVTFQKANALRFRVDKKYDLVWSAGLFDYLNDRLFTRLLRRFKKMTKLNGEIIIGNFSDQNPSQAYMELIDWILIHRSPEMLKELAIKADIAEEDISIGSEELNINLFLHIQNTYATSTRTQPPRERSSDELEHDDASLQ